MTLRIIPVLDVMNGVVVRGVAGRRSEYRPLVSRLTASCRPDDVAAALHGHFGFTEFYVADLDAIAGATFAGGILAALHDRGFHLWLDAGVVDDLAAVAVAQHGVERVVVGLETVASPEELGRCADGLGERVVFSLDLRGGMPLGTVENWRSADAFGLAARAVELGVRRILVLDLARVGMGGGLGTEELCGRVAATFPDVEVSAGGGVRGVEDLRQLRDAGVRNALVASTLHDGRLTPDDFAAL
jgi:phosphoribosylformimino-5-aminoimidazole carboxamide ribotide isomerase